VAFEVVETDNVRSAGGRPYSAALKVGDHLYLSGQVPIDGDGNTVGPGDPAGQWRQCFENTKELVEAAGATMADIYFLTIYVTDMRVYMDHGDIRKEYLSRPYPASTVVQIGSLAMPNWFIEIESIVYLGT
jgi:enamine deaminase RidA (YjgF/YER057c/UK114 family)